MLLSEHVPKIKIYIRCSRHTFYLLSDKRNECILKHKCYIHIQMHTHTYIHTYVHVTTYL